MPNTTSLLQQNDEHANGQLSAIDRLIELGTITRTAEVGAVRGSPPRVFEFRIRGLVSSSGDSMAHKTSMLMAHKTSMLPGTEWDHTALAVRIAPFKNDQEPWERNRALCNGLSGNSPAESKLGPSPRQESPPKRISSRRLLAPVSLHHVRHDQTVCDSASGFFPVHGKTARNAQRPHHPLFMPSAWNTENWVKGSKESTLVTCSCARESATLKKPTVQLQVRCQFQSPGDANSKKQRGSV
nr:hypothetical protein CFP56_56018 [Quercus suber]